MEVQIPTVMTPARLVSTNATEVYSTWATGVTYQTGDRVIHDQSVYESLQNSHSGNPPDLSPTYWVRIGPSNQWAMFDDQVSTATTKAAGPLTVVINTGIIDSIAAFNLACTTVRAVVRNGAGGAVVYDETQSLDASVVTDWYEYFFNDPENRRRHVLFTDIPAYANSQLTMDFQATANISVGNVTFGRIKQLGCLQYGVRTGIKDYSVKETDAFGTTTFVRRANSKTFSGTFWVDKINLNGINNTLTNLTATPCVWIGSRDPELLDTLLVFGYFRDFYSSIDYPTTAIYNIEIEGLT